MTKANPIDPNVPAGSEDPKLGDNRIRELAAAVAELLNVDHYMGTDGGAGAGYNEDAAGRHDKITLRAQTSNPTSVADTMIVFAKDVDDKAEAHLKDEDGNVIQLTAVGILNSLNLTGDQAVAGVKSFSSQIISTLADGTKPLNVTSATKCDNLNADKVDGYDIAAYDGGESYTFPGGLIIKMGTDNSTSDDDQNFTFGAAFSNACISVVTNRMDNPGGYQLSVKSFTKTRFTINRHDDIGGTIPFSWIAIGY